MRSSSTTDLKVEKIFDCESFAITTESNLSVVLDPAEGLGETGLQSRMELYVVLIDLGPVRAGFDCSVVT